MLTAISQRSIQYKTVEESCTGNSGKESAPQTTADSNAKSTPVRLLGITLTDSVETGKGNDWLLSARLDSW